MKNYVQLWFAVWKADPPPGIISYGWFESQEEANAFVEQNPPGGASQMYYVLLNKFILATLMTQYPPIFSGDGSDDDHSRAARFPNRVMRVIQQIQHYLDNFVGVGTNDWVG